MPWPVSWFRRGQLRRSPKIVKKEVLEDGNQEVRISGLQEREARNAQELWEIIESAANASRSQQVAPQPVGSNLMCSHGANHVSRYGNGLRTTYPTASNHDSSRCGAEMLTELQNSSPSKKEKKTWVILPYSCVELATRWLAARIAIFCVAVLAAGNLHIADVVLVSFIVVFFRSLLLK